MAAYACRRAMTLVEIITVVMILGILAAVTTVSFRKSTEGAWLQRATDRLVADLMLVRSNAMCDQQSRDLDIDSSLLSYTAVNTVDPDTMKPLSVSLSAYKITDMATNGWGSAEKVVFDKYGYPQQKGSISLQCRDRTQIISIGSEGNIESYVK